MKKYHLQIVVEQDEDGIYVASCPSLQGCYSQGDTFEEAIENVKDVIKMCLEEREINPNVKIQSSNKIQNPNAQNFDI